MTDLSPEASAATDAPVGPGRLIRRAREQAGLSIEDLGAQIKLARGTLDALERDDFRTLTEPVYVRGYYRKLSKVLPVAEAELLSAYEALVTPKSVPLPPSKLILSGESDLSEGSSWSGRKIAAMLIVGVLVGALAFWGNSLRSAPETAQPAPVVVPEPTPSSGLSSAETAAEPPAVETPPGVSPEPGLQPATPSPLSTTLTLAPSLSQPPAPVAAAPLPTATPTAAVPAPAPAGRPGRAEVQLQFNATSWTRIEDASGKLLLSGVIQAGDRQALSGEAPFSIFLGNAPGVSIQFNGQPVDMVRYTKGNNTAQFKLPQDGVR